MTMQHTAVGLILCAAAVLAVVALDFLTQRFAGSRASAEYRRARGPLSIPAATPDSLKIPTDVRDNAHIDP
jgi:hypothetical protein